MHKHLETKWQLGMLFLKGHSRPFSFIFVLFNQFKYRIKTEDFERIQTQISTVEGTQACHLTSTSARVFMVFCTQKKLKRRDETSFQLLALGDDCLESKGTNLKTDQKL